MWRKCLVIAAAAVLAQGANILEELKKNKKREEFYKLLSETEDKTVKSLLNNVVTIFAPSDAAIRAFKGEKDANFIKNHIAVDIPSSLQNGAENVAIGEDALKQRLTTILKGHPPLWIRKVGDTTYVNNAKVSIVTSNDNPNQRLYYIDAVLEPLIPKSKKDEDFVDIKAGDIINKNIYDLGEHSITKFANRVKELGISNFPELHDYAKATFFFPVDSAFDNMLPNVIDKEVVRTHIVPGQLLFTSPLTDNANGADYKHSSLKNYYKQTPMKTMVSMYKDNTGSAAAQSLTLVGSVSHKRNAKVVARVVKGNIPVANGVVHLIDKPLLVISSRLWESIEINNERQENNRFKKFAGYLEEFAPDLIEKIKATANATILVPNNDAFDQHTGPELRELLSSSKGQDILGLHIIDGIYLQSNDFRIHRPVSDTKVSKLFSELAYSLNPSEVMFSIGASYPEESTSKLWFWVNKTSAQIEAEKECEEKNQERCELDGRIMLDGGGTTAEVVEKDIGASNGIIQVINKVLGIPTSTLAEKLATDPMMRKTHSLGQQEHFNQQLSNKNKTGTKFTYLVPSDQAWEKCQKEFTTAYKQITMAKFWYQTIKLLDRHIKRRAMLTVEELMQMGKVQMSKGGELNFFNETVDGELRYMVSYETRKAVIVRPNIECTNGYIHVIDTVIMERRDVTLGDATGILPSMIALCSTFILTLLLL